MRSVGMRIAFGQHDGYLLSLASRSIAPLKGLFVAESSTEKPVSALLAMWQAGDEEALRSLLPAVYKELRRLAHRYLQKERPGHTLQSTALVHEAYLRLMKQGGARFENRAHFFAVCAHLMREILVEYARAHRAAKRNGGQAITFKDDIVVFKNRPVDLIALDDALNDLAKLDTQQSRIVELRFFGGLSIAETAQVLGISPASVKRDWATARAWLYHEIRRTEHDR